MAKIPPDFERMFGFHEEESEPRSTMLPEAAMMELEQHFADFVHEPGQCRFKVGDTVIPKANGLVRRTDDLPRKVVAVNPDAPYRFEGDPGSAGYGLRTDIRVICFHDNSIVAFWTESSYYEFYQPKE